MKERDLAPSQPTRIDAETLFREHARFVAGFVARLGLRGQDVDDVVQEVFLLVHRQGGFLPGNARATTWLAAIALRITLSWRRSQRRTPLLAQAEQVEGVESAMTPHDELVHARALRAVQAALDSIEIERRAIFLLYEIEGESCEAIATTFGIPVGTVYSRLHTARDEFMYAYSKRIGDEPLQGDNAAARSKP
jgi:RNA polymerase sigma-70 factor (ECF subfamily)